MSHGNLFFNLSGTQKQSTHSVNFILTHQDTSNNSKNCQITASTPLDTLIEDNFIRQMYDHTRVTIKLLSHHFPSSDAQRLNTLPTA